MTSYTVTPDAAGTEVSVLQAALDRSRNFTETVGVEFAGSEEEFRSALMLATDDDTDSATENDGTLDMWGWNNETLDGNMDWRLCVTLASPRREMNATEIGTRIGQAIARDVIADDLPREWTGLDDLDGDQLLVAGIEQDSDEWNAAEVAAKAAYLAVLAG